MLGGCGISRVYSLTSTFVCCINTVVHLFYGGLTYLPKNRIVSVFVSLMRNINGWSAIKVFGGSRGMAHPSSSTKAVAAAASVPSSLTSTNVLCIIALTNASGVCGNMVEKSAVSGLNMSTIPS